MTFRRSRPARSPSAMSFRPLQRLAVLSGASTNYICHLLPSYYPHREHIKHGRPWPQAAHARSLSQAVALITGLSAAVEGTQTDRGPGDNALSQTEGREEERKRSRVWAWVLRVNRQRSRAPSSAHVSEDHAVPEAGTQRQRATVQRRESSSVTGNGVWVRDEAPAGGPQRLPCRIWPKLRKIQEDDPVSTTRDTQRPLKSQ